MIDAIITVFCIVSAVGLATVAFMIVRLISETLPYHEDN